MGVMILLTLHSAGVQEIENRSSYSLVPLTATTTAKKGWWAVRTLLQSRGWWALPTLQVDHRRGEESRPGDRSYRSRGWCGRDLLWELYRAR